MQIALNNLICFKKIKFLAFGDCVAPGVLLAQGIGRWGNFMNGEAFGYETDWFCRMGLQNTLTAGQYMEVHPTFLYESLWNLLGVLAVYLFARYIGKKYDGQLVLMIFGWYGFGRMFIEGLRTDSLYIPGTELRTSQVLAAAIFVVCLGLLIYFFIKKPTAPLYHKEPAEGEAQDEFPLYDKIKEFFSAKKTAESKDANEDESNEENANSDKNE